MHGRLWAFSQAVIGICGHSWRPLRPCFLDCACVVGPLNSPTFYHGSNLPCRHLQSFLHWFRSFSCLLTYTDIFHLLQLLSTSCLHFLSVMWAFSSLTAGVKSACILFTPFRVWRAFLYQHLRAFSQITQVDARNKSNLSFSVANLGLRVSPTVLSDHRLHSSLLGFELPNV